MSVVIVIVLLIVLATVIYFVSMKSEYLPIDYRIYPELLPVEYIYPYDYRYDYPYVYASEAYIGNGGRFRHSRSSGHHDRR
jgi:hypothetical protein